MRQLLPNKRRNLGLVIAVVLVTTLSVLAIFGPRGGEARSNGSGTTPAQISGPGAQQQQGPGISAPTSTETWTGGDGSDSLWIRAGNWAGAGGAGPNDDLVFPQNALRKANNNQFDINTSFNSLTFTGRDYAIIGNQIILTSGINVDLTNAAPGAHPTFSPNIILGASQTWNSINGLVELNGVVNLNGKTLTLNGAGIHRFDGLINGTGSLVKNGTGTTIINGDADGFGSTTVNAGAVQVSGSLGTVNLNGGTLQGEGTVGAIVGNCSPCAGTIAPGNGGNDPGLLQSNGNVALIAAATLAVDINDTAVGSGYDRLGYGAGMSLNNAKLEVSVGFTPTVGQQFTIITGIGSLTGKFAQGNIVIGEGEIFTITYNSSSVVLTAQGSTLTWDGGGADNNWSTATNWNPDVAPEDDINLVFPAGVPADSLASNNDIVGLDVRSLSITGNGCLLNGGAITLSNGLTANNSAGAQSVINLGINLSTQAQTFSSSGALIFTITGPLNLGGFGLTVDSTNPMELAGTISGGGGITKNGAGTFFISNAINTYTGITSLNTSRTTITNTNSLGATGAGNHTVVANGATLALTGNVVNVPEAITITGQGVSGAGALRTGSFCSAGCSISGAITLASNTMMSVEAADKLTLNGAISGSGFGLTKVGAGTLVLGGSNNYSGGTTISTGTLLINGDNTFAGTTSLTGGTLGGSGRVGPLTATGGTVAPGNSPGKLDVSPILTFNAATTFSVEIGGPNPSDYDRLNVIASGTSNLGGANLTGTLVNGFNPATGSQFTILTNNSQPINGQFAQGTSVTIDGRQFSITYNTSSVVLTAGPRTLTWDGGGVDNKWSTAANWVGDLAPSQGDSLVFPAGVPADSLSQTNDITGLNLGSLAFTGNGYQLNGNAITLANGITANQPAGNNALINLDLTLSTQAQTFSNNGAANLNIGVVNLTGFGLTIDGARTITLATVSGSGGITKNGSSELGLSGNNSYAGVTNVNSGKLSLFNANSLGATGAANNTVVASGATLQINNNLAIPETLSLNGNGIGGNGVLTTSGCTTGCSISGNVTLAGDTRIGTIIASEKLTFNGVIAETGVSRALIKIGSGTVTLNASNDYTGTTEIHGGTLFVNGRILGSLALFGGTLGGTGTVGSISGGGTMAPGASAGILNVNGNVLFHAFTTLAVELNGSTAGSQYDQLNVTGSGVVSLGGGNLAGSIGGGFNPTDGTPFTIMQTTGTITGQFAQGSAISFGGKNFHITYNQQSVVLTAFTPNANNVQFSAATYNAAEGAFNASITVTRTGDTSGASTVDVATSDIGAEQRTDYTIGAGTITFAPGETGKTFDVLLVDDLYVEPGETLNLTLSNPTGGAVLGSPSVATLAITENDATAPTTNPLDNADQRFFVRQHFYDFLSRLPDPGGFDFWAGQITQCGANPTCINTKRLDVSNAFFFELEYQQTGSYVFRLYRAAFGNNQPFPSPDNSIPAEALKLPSYAVFALDRAKVVGGANLAAGQLGLASAFVQRPEFLARYPANLDGPAFVDAILATINNDLGANLNAQRAALINLFNSGGRGAVLYRLADDNASNPINNSAFLDAEYNRAFVATQYFGYLRRDPDIGGFLFWLGQVNSAPLRSLSKQRAMVCAFNTSGEYQFRFSSVATHSNAECPQ